MTLAAREAKVEEQGIIFKPCEYHEHVETGDDYRFINRDFGSKRKHQHLLKASAHNLNLISLNLAEHVLLKPRARYLNTIFNHRSEHMGKDEECMSLHDFANGKQDVKCQV